MAHGLTDFILSRWVSWSTIRRVVKSLITFIFLSRKERVQFDKVSRYGRVSDCVLMDTRVDNFKDREALLWP